nr:2,5-diketo-D-gluconic acid reductase A [Candidatus Pantoea persica]
MADQPIIKLHDGNMIPQLGLDVWKASNEDAHRAVLKALEVGYRSIDTAAAYKNEEAIGKALQNTDVARDDIFVTTKLWNDDQQNVQQAMETSLQKLQLEQVDLYLMHWPCLEKDHYVDAWKEMIKLQQQGLAKSIASVTSTKRT